MEKGTRTLDELAIERVNPRFRDTVADIRKYLFRRSRILMVVDDSAIGYTEFDGFGIGRVVEIMSTATIGLAGFDVKLAGRSGTQGTNPAAGRHELTYRGFRFDQQESGAPIIHHFDQIWCFGFEPGNDAPDNLDPAIDGHVLNSPLATTTSELAALARWMNERQGGLFGTGDHHYLGASLCSRMPRLGRMRKWTVTDGVPTMHYETRLDTNRPANADQAAGTQMIPNAAEGDTEPQRIEWVADAVVRAPYRIVRRPHPILCHPLHGPINVMPDHPHEGRCFDPSDAGWIATHRDAAYNFDGYTGDEFPTKNGLRPLPQIIAWGNTLADPPLDHQKGDQPARRFPMISVYDGQAIGIGRVVTDSTWHHWFNLNLDGLAGETPSTEYEKIERYYINIGAWLASAAWRWSSTIGKLATSKYTYFGLNFRDLSQSVFEIGRAHIDYLRPSLGPCAVSSFVKDRLFEIDPRLVRWYEELGRRPSPCLTCPPIDIVEDAVIGGIAKAMFADENALRTRSAHADEARLELKHEDLEHRVRVGVARGLADMMKAYEQSLHETRDRLTVLAKYAENVKL